MFDVTLAVPLRSSEFVCAAVPTCGAVLPVPPGAPLTRAAPVPWVIIKLPDFAAVPKRAPLAVIPVGSSPRVNV